MESGPGPRVLREYLVTLNSNEVKRNWSYPLQSEESIESVSLTESFRDGYLVLGINQAATDQTRSEIRILEVAQTAEPTLLVDLRIKGTKSWRVGPIQKVESLYDL